MLAVRPLQRVERAFVVTRADVGVHVDGRSHVAFAAAPSQLVDDASRVPAPTTPRVGPGQQRQGGRIAIPDGDGAFGRLHRLVETRRVDQGEAEEPQRLHPVRIGGEPDGVVATAWVLQHPAVDSAIVGVRTVEQLDGLERAGSLVLEPEVMTRLDTIFNINNGRRIGPGASPEAHSW